jgi:hypothetical protein
MKSGHHWEDFEWHRADDGYRWTETKLGPTLVAVQQSGPLRMTKYRPFSEQYLFRDFARLDPSPEAVLGFANRFGMLGYPVALDFLGNEPWTLTSSDPPEVFNASNLPPVELSGFLGCVVGEPLDNDQPKGWSWTAQIRRVRNFLAQQSVLNKEPERAASLQMSANDALEQTAGPYLTWSPTTRSFHLQLRPRSLIGAVWLQAAMAASVPKTFRQCLVCKTPIEISISQTGTRTDAKFCSNQCKTRDYRERKAKARVLRQKGWSLPRIARKLRSDTQTVRQWVK